MILQNQIVGQILGQILGLIGAPGIPELIIIGLIVLLLFGGAKLPGLMRNLGRSTNEFKRGMKETLDTDDSHGDETA